jgi:hypothetical protein
MFGLPWPGGPGPAEATVALAPSIISRDELGDDARDILDVADAYAECTPSKLVFFSDLTLWLDCHGSDWGARRTDWEAGVDELIGGPFPALYFALDQVSHAILCDASRQGLILYYRDGSEQVTPVRRQELRSVLEGQLGAEWPAYIRRVLN